MTHFTNTFNLLKISLKVFRANRENGHYHRFVKRLARDLISESHALNDGSVNDKVFKKIQWYMVSTLFMGELLAELTGRELTKEKKKAFVCLGAAGGLSDVLIDENKYGKNQMLTLLHNDNNLQNTALENIFRLYFKNLLTHLEPEQKKFMLKCMEELFHWQAESLNQFNIDISKKEVEMITEGKGGLSILLCAIILNEYDEDLKRALYKLGGFIQFMNDTQDLHKDSRDGIRTYVYFKKSFDDVFRFLEEKRLECFSDVQKLNFPLKRKVYFLFCFYAMNVGILYKLKCFSKLTGGNFDLSRIAEMKKEDFRVNSFSRDAFAFCYPKIIRYNYETSLEEMKMLF